jgi:hypothetical protein
MKIASVDKRYLDRSTAESACGVETRESTADYYHAMRFGFAAAGFSGTCCKRHCSMQNEK